MCGLGDLLFVLQNRARSKFIAKYEKKIHELTSECKLKTDECYTAWSSVTATNEELERLKMEYHNTIIQAESLGNKLNFVFECFCFVYGLFLYVYLITILLLERTVETQTDKLRDVFERYEHDKKLWIYAISNLEVRIKVKFQIHHI